MSRDEARRHLGDADEARIEAEKAGVDPHVTEALHALTAAVSVVLDLLPEQPTPAPEPAPSTLTLDSDGPAGPFLRHFGIKPATPTGGMVGESCTPYCQGPCSQECEPTGGTVDEEPGVGAVVQDAEGTVFGRLDGGIWCAFGETSVLTWDEINQEQPVTLLRPAPPGPTPQPADLALDGDEVEALARVISTYRGTPADRIARAALAHALAILHAHGYRQVGDGQVVVQRDDLLRLLARYESYAGDGDETDDVARLRAALDAGGAT